MKGTKTMEAQTYKVQSQVFDIDAFEKTTLVKNFQFAPVETVEEAMQRLGGDTAKFLAVVNEGLVSAVREQVKNSPDGWMVEDEKGNLEPFTGNAVDDSQVNSLVLSMAKASFGYLNAKNKDEKKAAKDKAIAVVKGTPVLLEGLKAQVLAK